MLRILFGICEGAKIFLLVCLVLLLLFVSLLICLMFRIVFGICLMMKKALFEVEVCYSRNFRGILIVWKSVLVISYWFKNV